MRSRDLVGVLSTSRVLLEPFLEVDADRSLSSDVPEILTGAAALRATLDAIELRALAAHAAEDLALVDACRSTAQWWVLQTGCTYAHAKDRVILAQRLFTGDLAQAGEALTRGEISVDHAREIHLGTRRLLVADVVRLERILLSGIRHGAEPLTPEMIRVAAAHARHLLEDDSTALERFERQQASRSVNLTRVGDMWHLTGHLTAECGELLLAHLIARSQPVPGSDGQPDDRAHHQRLHDAMESIAATAGSGDDEIVSRSPVAVNVVLTSADVERLSHSAPPLTPADRALARQACSADTLTWTAIHHHQRPRNLHGSLTDTEEAVLRSALARIAPALGGIPTDVLNQGRRKRLATDAQHRALALRDGGCTFPHCTAPPGWTQAHHYKQDWHLGGLTDIDDLALLCVFHHHHVHEGGWTLTRTTEGSWTATPPASQAQRDVA
jgi:hypothetical protein